jgi:hypothetical protein
LDLALRIALSGLVVYGFWTAFAIFGLVQSNRLFDSGYARREGGSEGDIGPRTGERRPAETPDLPFPLFPGARDLDHGRIDLNGKPFYRCEYDVSAAPARVLRYYSGHYRRRGWRDTTEETLGIALRPSPRNAYRVVDLQNEALLRRYDHLKRTQASFARGDRYVLVAAKEGDRPWRCRVGIQYSEVGSPKRFAAELDRSLGLSGRASSSPQPFTFTQRYGTGEAQTEIFRSRRSSGALYADLVQRYRYAGWKLLPLPRQRDADGPGRHACFMRSDEMAMLNVLPGPRGRGAQAMITTLRNP